MFKKYSLLLFMPLGYDYYKVQSVVVKPSVQCTVKMKTDVIYSGPGTWTYCLQLLGDEAVGLSLEQVHGHLAVTTVTLLALNTII